MPFYLSWHLGSMVRSSGRPLLSHDYHWRASPFIFFYRPVVPAGQQKGPEYAARPMD